MKDRDRKTAHYLKDIYKKLHKTFGPQQWWPAESPFEVIVGAILTQNTAWTNVEKAITCLKKKKLLNPRKLYKIDKKDLAKLIRPCGYYNVKSARLKSFLQKLFSEFKGDLGSMFSLDTCALRDCLLQVNGIGPETADSILLYAANRPVFVIDAYTRRFLNRHGLVGKDADYQHIQLLFEKNLPRKTSLFNEYHALIVRLAKDFCRKKPLCDKCPLKRAKGA
ncbi:MAG: endonuclease III domain-containing protein [Candidatus Omnitrophica bacterium]|nr:endonuclease III domain-containing protein [Candidatus Omnitrophota bacterium]